MSELVPFEEEECQAEEIEPVQVDIYGVKLDFTPSPSKDADARITAAELWEDVKQSTLRFCRDCVGLLADFATGSRSIVRGLSGMRGAEMAKVRRAHQLSEKRESEAQQQAITKEAKQQSVNELLETLQRLQAQGIAARIVQLPSGQFVIYAVRPDSEEIVGELADEAVAGYLEGRQPATSDENQRLAELLSTPISELRLSRRARRFLEELEIRTLADLTRVSKKELWVKGKQFGEVSDEIEVFLRQHGIELRKPEHSFPPALGDEDDDDEPDESYHEPYLRPLADLNFSMNVRKALVMLGLNTIGELSKKSASDFMALPDFEPEWLDEIREKLREVGFDLADAAR